MRYWTYIEPTSEDDSTEVVNILSEDDIIAIYWDWWYCQMVKAGKDREICRQNCIDDWVVVHWAWETDALGYHQYRLPFEGGVDTK